jgi:hypothetical protein
MRTAGLRLPLRARASSHARASVANGPRRPDCAGLARSVRPSIHRAATGYHRPCVSDVSDDRARAPPDSVSTRRRPPRGALERDGVLSRSPGLRGSRRRGFVSVHGPGARPRRRSRVLRRFGPGSDGPTRRVRGPGIALDARGGPGRYGQNRMRRSDTPGRRPFALHASTPCTCRTGPGALPRARSRLHARRVHDRRRVFGGVRSWGVS